MLQIKKKEKGFFPLLFFIREYRAVFFLFSYSDYSFISDSFAYRAMTCMYANMCLYKYVFTHIHIYI